MLTCRPVLQLQECVRDRDCRKLLQTKVDRGQALMQAYR